MKRVITYDTCDLFHYGHIALLKHTRALGDFLAVILSSDEFGAGRGKQLYFSCGERKMTFEIIRYVGLVVPKLTRGQKIGDIAKYGIDVFVMRDDWNDGFGDQLKGLCGVVYLPRTPRVSTTRIKSDIHLGRMVH